VRYVLINPFPSTRRNGITTYVQHVQHMLEARGIACTCIANDRQVPRAEYLGLLADALTAPLPAPFR